MKYPSIYTGYEQRPQLKTKLLTKIHDAKYGARYQPLLPRLPTRFVPFLGV